MFSLNPALIFSKVWNSDFLNYGRPGNYSGKWKVLAFSIKKQQQHRFEFSAFPCQTLIDDGASSLDEWYGTVGYVYGDILSQKRQSVNVYED